MVVEEVFDNISITMNGDFVGYIGEQGQPLWWVATSSLCIQREASQASTPLQSGCHECSGKEAPWIGIITDIPSFPLIISW